MKKRFKKIYIEITNICNLSCEFCKPDNRKKKYMNEIEFKQIIEKIQPYTDYIYLHVKGEPLLHPKINELITIANEAKLQVNITTNGTLIDRLQNRKVRQINYSIQSSNDVSQIREVIQKLKQIAKEANTYISLRLWRKATRENQKIEEMLREEFPEMKEIEDKKAVAHNIFLSLEEEFQWPSMQEEREQKEGYCHGLLEQIAILVDGSVIPCCLDHEGNMILGNIYEEELESILQSKRAIAIQQGFKSRKLVEPLCQKCQYRLKF